MFDFSTLPLSPDAARAARHYFGWSQLAAADQSSLPVHKLKRFEAGNYIPDPEFLAALRAFYESQGYDFGDTPAPGAGAMSAGLVFPAGVVGESDEPSPASSYRERHGAACVHHMRIALQDDADIGRALDLIEDNEERLAALLREPLRSGLFTTVSEQSQANHAEAVRLLAENGMLFARLFGRELSGDTTGEALAASKGAPTTTGDLLRNLQADTHLAAQGDRDAATRRRNRKAAGSIAQALGLA